MEGELRLYRCGSENASDVSNVKTLQSTKGKDMATATGKQIERVPNAINLLFLLPLSLSLSLSLSFLVNGHRTCCVPDINSTG